MTIATTFRITPDLIPGQARTRPPGALSETLLMDVCTGCGDCVSVCPGALLLLDREGFPLLLSTSLCSGCGLCAEVCTPEAIRFTPRTRAGLGYLKEAESRARA